MMDTFLHLSFIAPGGPEILVVMLVLLMMFGAKDAPRILRKLNEIMSQIRKAADGFKREVMYGDLHHDTSEERFREVDHNEENAYVDDDEDLVDVVSQELNEDLSEDEEGDAQKT